MNVTPALLATTVRIGAAPEIPPLAPDDILAPLTADE